MTAAIYFHPDAYSTNGPQLMGRNAAGESFLRAYFNQPRQQEYWCAVGAAEHANAYTQLVLAAHPGATVKAALPIGMHNLAEPGVLFLPGPGLADFAWPRGSGGHVQYSLCGVTHTTSSQIAMDAIVSLVTAPLRSWDALICTSTAVRSNVDLVIDAQLEHCRHRFGAANCELPQRPVIPLGIHTDDFRSDPAQKAAARAALSIEDDEVVVLFMGRLSFHAKAHPMAMYQALQAVAQSTGRRLVLIECGWFANQPIRQAFEAASSRIAPDVRVLHPDGRLKAQRQTAWRAADIFCSLADNIQETFGITPIEAMASGLPVVVSDWDGYRDTVRHGVDGFRVSTLAPPAGAGADLAMRHALGMDTYDMYCGYTSTLVAVDIEETAQSLARLVASPELRSEMGRAGQVRACEVFDWAVVMPAYQQLWQELQARRLAEPAVAQAADAKSVHPWPARLDPFYAFRGYASHTLSPDSIMVINGSDPDDILARLQRMYPLAMVNFAKAVLPTHEECEAVVKRAASGPARALDLLADVTPERRPQVFRGLVWLVKMGVLRRLNGAPSFG
jgi:starch synthase